MCLGIPGKIIAITNAEHKLAMIDVSGVQRQVNIACVVEEGQTVESCVGDWVLIHVGFAMARINEEEAALTLEILRELGEVQEELEAMRKSEGGPALSERMVGSRQ